MRRAVALLAVPAGLLGVLALEAGALWDGDAPPGPGVAAAGIAGASAVAPGAAPPGAASVATLLGRPLFSSNRRPPVGGQAAALGLPRLSGVLVSDAGRLAVFAGAEGARGSVVPEGGVVGAFTVRSIAPGAVTVDGPGGTRVLRPGFGGTSAVAAAAPAASPSVADLLRHGLPAVPPTPGLPTILGAQSPPPEPPAEVAASFQRFLAVPVAGASLAVPGFPASRP